MAHRKGPLLDTRTALVLLLAVVAGVLVGLSQGLGAGALAGLAAAGILHRLLGR